MRSITKDEHWKKLCLLLPASALVGTTLIFLALAVFATEPSGSLDLRLIGMVVSLIVFVWIWVVMLRLRRRCTLQDSSPSLKKALQTLATACILEVSLFLIATLAGYSSLALYILMGNVLLGVAVLMLVVSIRVLRIPVRWAFVIPATLIIIAGAAFSMYLLSTITDI